MSARRQPQQSHPASPPLLRPTPRRSPHRPTPFTPATPSSHRRAVRLAAPHRSPTATPSSHATPFASPPHTVHPRHSFVPPPRHSPRRPTPFTHRYSFDPRLAAPRLSSTPRRSPHRPTPFTHRYSFDPRLAAPTPFTPATPSSHRHVVRFAARHRSPTAAPFASLSTCSATKTPRRCGVLSVHRWSGVSISPRRRPLELRRSALI